LLAPFGFGSSPFAASNSRSTPKIRHSLTFALLLNKPRATLPHHRSCPGPNRDSLLLSTPRSTTYYPPLAARSLYRGPSPSSRAFVFILLQSPFPATPLCSPSSKSPGAGGCHSVSVQPRMRQTSPKTRQLFCLHRLAASLPSLFTLFCPRFLCFQSVAASFTKTPGGGGLDALHQIRTMAQGNRALRAGNQEVST
jgi:hypothetical protein